jgi:amidase
VSDEDALVVKRLKEAGAIILGKTNVPTLLADYQTDGPVYGRANNPYDTARTPGGSTGGGAAAVAAGLTPLELGSDLGGSIRVPAHYCGLFALKPSENVIPLHGHFPPLPGSKGGVHHMGTFGPLARSLDDVRLVFDIIKGPDECDTSVAPVAWQKPSGRNLSEYTVAWTDTFGPFHAESETAGLLSDLADRISQPGTTISKQTPRAFDFEAAFEAWGQIFGYIMGEDTPLPIRTLLKLRWMARRGSGAKGIRRGLRIDFIDYARVLTLRKKLISQLQAFFTEVDFWLCPVAMTPAFTHRRVRRDIAVDGVDTPYFTATGAFASVFSLTGNPALVIPLGQSRDGLPIGLQIVGPYWSEPELLHLGRQLAELTPGYHPPQKDQAGAFADRS